MASKILVSLSSRSASFALFDRAGLSQLTTQDNDERAYGVFGTLLQRYADTPVYLMVDTVEEEYRAEVLPHVSGRARREMLKRKLNQLLRTAPYRTSWLQGREPGGARRDDMYLFLALNTGELLRPYLELIQVQRAPLAGIYLLPLVTQALATRLPCATPGALIVSRQQSGLRQSFFLNGRLRISRLTPFDAFEETPSLNFYAAEIEKSRLFLYNSRQLPRDAKLTTQILDCDGSLGDLIPLLATDSSVNYRRLGLKDICTALSLTTSQLRPDAEALHLYLLGKYTPPASLAAPRLTSEFTAHQARLALYLASAAILFLGVIFSAYSLYRAYDQQQQTQVAIKDAARYDALYQTAARQFPATPVSAENLRKAVEVTRQLQRYGRTPENFMLSVAQALQLFPQINLQNLEWHYAMAGSTTPQSQDVEPSGWRQRGDLEAEIHPFQGDYRSALALIERFADSLRTQPHVASVSIAKLPVNLDPASTLSGSTQEDIDAKPGAALFKLHIVLKADA